ncbi:Actin-related protein 5 [Larimichthys crocea]|uniref:Uncharacterized protein n=1 Tax=Larimichthys crocea TaxID=215358 RepID=A0ACD3RAQ9_LARCR|nr:Actin-related protein 5 [Larimichthys crocea]
MLFRSVAARSRGAARSETQIGNDIPNLEPLRWLLKSQFDRNVVVNFEIQELILDHVFTHLGISSEGSVAHPIVLTEAPCNPLHCRQMMSELLFECYRVPYVSYGVDSLYSFYHNNTQRNLQPPHTGIVLSSGYHCSHILPVINGRLDAVNCKRVNVAGSQAASYLQRLLQLKYPGHLAAITLSRVEELLHEHSYTAVDYHEELEKWRSPEFYDREVHRMQLPFSGKVPGGCVSVEERQERRAQQLRRLQEINARRREEKLLQDQERLDRLMAVQELLEDGLLDQFHKSLVELNMDSAEELQSYISKLQLAVEQGRQKLLHSDGAEGRTEVSELEQPMDEGDGVALMDPDFPEDTLPEKPTNVVQPCVQHGGVPPAVRGDGASAVSRDPVPALADRRGPDGTDGDAAVRPGQVHSGAAGGAGEQCVSDRREHAVPRDERESGERAAGYETLPVTLQGDNGVTSGRGRLVRGTRLGSGASTCRRGRSGRGMDQQTGLRGERRRVPERALCL